MDIVSVPAFLMQQSVVKCVNRGAWLSLVSEVVLARQTDLESEQFSDHERSVGTRVEDAYLPLAGVVWVVYALGPIIEASGLQSCHEILSKTHFKAQKKLA